MSTSQAIVGAIIGWNFFSGSLTDYNTLSKIVITWIACPILSAMIALILYKALVFGIYRMKIDMFRLDSMTRYGLIIIGAFGSYNLGANNIANVTSEAMARIQKQGISLKETESIIGKEFPNAEHFKRALSKSKDLKPKERAFILKSAEIDYMEITIGKLDTINFDPDLDYHEGKK